MSETKVIIRDPRDQLDDPMIYATWISALWYAMPQNKKTDRNISGEFHRHHTSIIKRIISSKNNSVKVACLSDDPDLMIGYSVMTGKNIEFVFVKADYRRRGIGKLLTKGFETVSHPKTNIGERLTEKMNLAVQGEEHERKESSKDSRQPKEADPT